MPDISLVAAVAAAIPPTLIALAAYLKTRENAKAALAAKVAAALAQERAEEAKAVIIRTEQGVFELGKAVDGRLTELLRLTHEAAHSAGLAEGIQIEQERIRRAASAEAPKEPTAPAVVVVTVPPAAAKGSKGQKAPEPDSGMGEHTHGEE